MQLEIRTYIWCEVLYSVREVGIDRKQGSAFSSEAVLKLKIRGSWISVAREMFAY